MHHLRKIATVTEMQFIKKCNHGCSRSDMNCVWMIFMNYLAVLALLNSSGLGAVDWFCQAHLLLCFPVHLFSEYLYQSINTAQTLMHSPKFCHQLITFPSCNTEMWVTGWVQVHAASECSPIRLVLSEWLFFSSRREFIQIYLSLLLSLSPPELYLPWLS